MKLRINFIVDIAALIAFSACAITGIVKMPELSVYLSNGTYELLTVLHDWSGAVSLALVAVHVLLHVTWLSAAGKRIFGKKTPPSAVRTSGNAAKKGVMIALLGAVFALGGSNLWAHGHVSNATVPLGIDYPAGSLKDGVYTGSAMAYRPNLQVRVTVKNGSIAAVQVTDHSETMRWYFQVVPRILDAIVDSGGTDVDSVSGATASSHGILSAVENALSSAKK